MDQAIMKTQRFFKTRTNFKTKVYGLGVQQQEIQFPSEMYGVLIYIFEQQDYSKRQIWEVIEGIKSEYSVYNIEASIVHKTLKFRSIRRSNPATFIVLFDTHNKYLLEASMEFITKCTVLL